MNMTGIDWLIMAGVYCALVLGVLVSRRYMRSVADFLAAGRTAGRYLISVSQGIAGIGAITLIANMEMNLEAGFSMSWWGLSMALFVTIVVASGWISYRFRATRCLTMAEFFERRYSKKFRVFAGFVAYGSGIINFGIYPAVGARFFIYFMGLPPEFDVLGLTLETFPVAMLALLLTALYFVTVGGQVAIIITDFIQGLFTNIVFLVIPIYLLTLVSEDQIIEVLSNHAPGKSRIDPFDTGNVESFNFGFFMIGVIGLFYNALSWQGTQGYNTSAKSAHEAKMGGVLGLWRGMPSGLFMMLLPIIAVTVLQHPDFGETAQHVTSALQGEPNPALHSQLQTPLTLTRLLPAGLMGLFCAMMLAAFITTNDSYLHSWGSIFIQDVVMPLRKKPLSPEGHIRILRWSIVGVAAFIFCFSMIYRESEQILMYFAVTGAIFAGGSGAVIIGGLYWKRGTTAGAFAAMITGGTLAVIGVVDSDRSIIPLNGMEVWLLAMGASALVYVVVSLVARRPFDLEGLLRRTDDVEHKEQVVLGGKSWRRMLRLGLDNPEFTKRDKVIYILSYVWTGMQVSVFIVGTTIALTIGIDKGFWLDFWKGYVALLLGLSAIVIVWFTVGGLRDLRRMTAALGTQERDHTDDGRVKE